MSTILNPTSKKKPEQGPFQFIININPGNVQAKLIPNKNPGPTNKLLTEIILQTLIQLNGVRTIQDSTKQWVVETVANALFKHE